MYRQYPYNSDTHPGISTNSFNILALDYIIVLNKELVEVSSAFWNYTPRGPCSIQFSFHKIPAGRNYICLCAVDTEYHNRLYLVEDKKHYHIKATRELNRHGLVGMILQFIPITHRAKPWENRLWTSRVPTLQFLAAGYISEEESKTTHHLSTNPDTEELDCLRKKCYQIEVKYELNVNQWFGGMWIENMCKCAYPDLHLYK